MQWLLLMGEFFIGGTKTALKRTDQRGNVYKRYHVGYDTGIVARLLVSRAYHNS